MNALISLPDASSTFATIGTYSTEMFDQFWLVAVFGVGFLVGGILLRYVIRAVMSGIRSFAGGGRGRRFRRR